MSRDGKDKYPFSQAGLLNLAGPPGHRTHVCFGTRKADIKILMNKSDSDFDPDEPFEIDGSLLDMVSSDYAFALGVEWQMFRERLKTRQPFTTLCLSANTNRLVKLAEHQRRFVEDRPTDWPAWREIWVGDSQI